MSDASQANNIIRIWIAIAAALLAVLILLGALLIWGWKETRDSLSGEAFAGLLLFVVGFLAHHLLLGRTQEVLRHEEIQRIANSLRSELVPTSNVRLQVSGWYDLPWEELLKDAREIQLVVSYMDTWLNHTSNELSAVFSRGGHMEVYLPKGGTPAAVRVRDRFPELAPRVVANKIESTSSRLHSLLKGSGVSTAKLDVYRTTTFSMWCLVRIDGRMLIISPYDHFRPRQRIENPTFVIDCESFPSWNEWAKKELDGFRSTSDLETFTTAAKN